MRIGKGLIYGLDCMISHPTIIDQNSKPTPVIFFLIKERGFKWKKSQVRIGKKLKKELSSFSDGTNWLV